MDYNVGKPPFIDISIPKAWDDNPMITTKVQRKTSFAGHIRWVLSVTEERNGKYTFSRYSHLKSRQVSPGSGVSMSQEGQ